MATAASRLSSSRARARLALWLVVALLLAAVAVGYLVVDRGSPRRDAVAAYIEQANDVQSGLLTRLGSINTAYARLRLDPKTAAAQAPTLAQAERTIASARRRLAAVEPPPDARVLHARLLRLLALERSLAADVTDLARHLGLITTGMQELAAATARLSRELQQGTSTAAQARAFDGYSTRLDAAAARVSKTTVPVLLASSRGDDVARLNRISTVADDLGRAIKAGNVADVRSLLRRLQREVRAAAGASGRSFVTVYNQRVRRIGAARVAVETELRRLGREL